MLVYFVLLTVVLVSQLTGKKEVVVTEPVVNNAMYQNKFDDAVVIYDKSPVMLVNRQQLLVDEKNCDIVPFIEDDVVYVPLSFFSSAYNATPNFNQTKGEASVRLDNTAIVFYNYKNKGLIVSSNAQEEIDCGASMIIKDDIAYVPLNAFADTFKKQVSVYDKLVVVSAEGNVFDEEIDQGLLNEVIAQVDNLPVVATESKLRQLINADTNVASRIYDRVMGKRTNYINDPTGMEKTDSVVENDGYSQTNEQVAGVHEADIVKTDGEYIYTISANQSISIVRAKDYKNMSVASQISMDDNYNAKELYLNDNKLIVVGELFRYSKVYMQPEGIRKIETVDEIEIVNTFRCVQTIAEIYDITDKANPTLLRKVGMDGNYLDSRNIGDKLYLLSKTGVYNLLKDNEFIPPCYYDSRLEVCDTRADFNDIRYFPGMTDYQYMTICSVDLSDLSKEACMNTYLGAGENVYMSENNLYVAQSGYNYVQNAFTESSMFKNTNIYKFALNEGTPRYNCVTSVTGYILNQFSMDEHNGYFRIATTTGDSNAMYVLDSNFEVCGKIDGIAPGERMYSARFMGNRAYMVTFKITDPLFVIDLTAPEKPTILGALKIPGYSEYLHPYDENHLIGFGKDTIEYKNAAYYLGMKVSMFDVTDLTNPKEMFTTVIGDRRTESILLNNHKALLFDKDKNLMAFPVDLYTVDEAVEDSEVIAEEETEIQKLLRYGTFKYQGAFIYGIDMEKGFIEQARITHISDEDYLKIGNYYASADDAVERILYIGDNLYTISRGKIVACKIGTYEEQYSVDIK